MEFRIEIVDYAGGRVASRAVEAASKGLTAELVADGSDRLVRARATEDVADFGLELVISLPEWRGGYLLVPGAVYDGNRFEVLPEGYPPMFDRERPDQRAPVVTDVPRLPSFHLLAGDASYPAIGGWDRNTGRVWGVLFPAQTSLGSVGLQVDESEAGLEIRIGFPGIRAERYTMVNSRSKSYDEPASVPDGWSMEARVSFVQDEASDVDGLFALLDANRHRVVEAGSAVPLRSFSSSAELVHDVTMETRWNDSPPFFETSDSDHGTPFQVGWTGGGITSFALLESDDSLARERARRNVDFVCSQLQGASGFYCGGYRDGIENDGFGRPYAQDWVMVRKNGDFLLFLMRHILSLRASGEGVPSVWLESGRRCAEAFTRNAEDWGQFVDVRDGRVTVGGSACGGTAIAGMVLAAEILREPRYLHAAAAAGERYASQSVLPGLLTGGPGEILNAPDSESAFGLLEGYIALWEAMGDSEWIDLAERTARQAASWVVPYDFPFPGESTFGQMGMRTGGTVIANVQNKHSAPGICTLSALALVKLFRATGERRWLELAGEISHSLSQYVSSSERPIITEDGRPMPPGWVNERVNMADWEAPKRGLGEVYYGPCWPMPTVLLTALEVPSVYVDPHRGVVWCLDHVAARLEDERLIVTNPTEFDAHVSILLDLNPARALGELWWRRAERRFVPAGTTVEIGLVARV